MTECPMDFIGGRVSRDIALAIWAKQGHLPESGGILDQPAKFLHTWQAFQHDVNRIDTDRQERKRG